MTFMTPSRLVCILRVAVCGSLFVLCASGEANASTDCSFTTIGTTMRLVADCTTDATIFVPHGFTLDGAGHTVTIVDPPGDHWRGAVIRNAGSRANVRRLTIAVLGLQHVCDQGPGDFGEDRLRGIAFYGASGAITNNRIVGLNQGTGDSCNEGTGILAQNAPFDGSNLHTARVTIEGNQIADVQQYGIAAQGDVAVNVEDNTIDLWNQVGPISQFGISLAYGATGNVHDNVIRGGYTDAAGFFPTGVSLLEASGALVTANRISRVQEGIFVQAYCLRVPEANHNTIVANALTGVTEGIVLVARSINTATNTSLCNAHVDRNLVSLNIIRSAPEVTPLTGIFYGQQVLSGSFVPVADRNAVTFNLIVGYLNPLFDAGSTNTLLVKNVVK